MFTNKSQAFQTVFVGCSYTPAPTFKKIEKTFNALPITPVIALQKSEPEAILHKVKRLISACDTAFFELSKENQSVALELGYTMATLDSYYIVCKEKAENTQMANLEGINYIKYKSLEPIIKKGNTFRVNQNSLWYSLAKVVTENHGVLNEFWSAMSAQGYSEPVKDKMWYFAYNVLSILRTSSNISQKRMMKQLSGFGMQSKDKLEVFRMMERHDLIQERTAAGPSIALHKKVEFKSVLNASVQQ